jgi:putative membrane protein
VFASASAVRDALESGALPATSVDTSWTWAPIAIASLVAYAAIYAVRWSRVRGAQRARGGAVRGASVWRLASWLLGIALIFVALISPVDRISEQLASAHMVQHLLLADLAPIALILGLTKMILRPATRRIHAIERRLGPFAHPVFGVVAYVGMMWLWHVPPFYDAALHHAGVHVLEHLCFAFAGGLYWWHLLSPIRSRLRLGGMGPVAYMVSTKVLVGFLGIGLAFYPERLYDYGPGGVRWGMTPTDDQHVAGLLMGLEQSIIMGIALAYLFSRMLLESEREEQRRERMEDAQASSTAPSST